MGSVRVMRSVWLVAVTALVGSLLGVTGVVAQGVAPVGSPLAAPAASAAPVAGGLGYTALSSPCRAVDTRSAGGVLTPGGSRAFRMRGSVSFAAQGGSTSGCGVPSSATAVEVSVSSVTPSGASGFLRAFAAGSSVSATFLSYTAGRGITNTGTVPLNTAVTNDLGVSNSGGSTHVVIDIQGYFAPSGGASYVPLASPCRVVDTRGGGGRLAAGGVRALQVAGTGSVFAAQGGTAGGCGVPDGVPGVEVTVSVVSPSGANGFVRVAPNDGSVPTSTFLNYTAGTGISNTGSITLSNTVVRDVSVRNFGGSVDVVIDVQGYYTTAAGLGTRYQAVTPCRAVDTRTAGGALAAGQTRSFQIAGERVGYARQGAQSPTGCGVPQRAAAVEASVTAVNPTGTGFTRPGPAGAVASGTFLNYTSVGAITNTGTLPLALGGTADLGVTNLGASASYTIDVYGYYEPPATLPRSADSLEAGYQHTCMVVGGGAEVRCWGWNEFGQLGNGQRGSGTTLNRTTPVTVPGLTGVVQVGTGSSHSCALLSGGTVRCWGWNLYGQLGDGTNTDRSTPTAVTGLSNVVQLSVGSSHNCALLADGTVRCWGRNNFSQLGDATTSSRSTPVAVVGLNGVVDVSVDGSHSCALLAAGTVRCWGWNNSGQLGDGTNVNRNAPTTVAGLTGVIQIWSGLANVCGLLADGTVRCWGNNIYGTVGDGTTVDRYLPTAVSGLTGVVQLTAGSASCALRADGTARCWGYNANAQFGNGTTTSSPTPVAVSGLTGIAQLSAGELNGCAVLATGTVRCWGYSDGGQVGNGTTFGLPTLVPAAVAGFSGVVQVTAGTDHSCALLADGTARCWGSNAAGQLGDNSLSSRSTPTVVSGLSGAVQIAAGDDHTCALILGGSVRCWGRGDLGQLGDGTGAQRLTPAAVTGITGAVDLAVGSYHSCVVLSSGALRCWGDNSDGQLGDGDTVQRNSPVAVLGITDAAQVTGGGFHTCAALTNGGARCWGDGEFGQLGGGNTLSGTAPIAVVGLDGVVDLSAALVHTCAVLGDGSARCWGRNNFGQLGDDTTDNRTAPVVVGSLAGAVAPAGGGSRTCAVLALGAARCWGRNAVGQLGDGTTTDRRLPVAVGLDGGAQHLDAGEAHACAVLSTGGVRCWGENEFGNLGDGTSIDRSTPTVVFGLA